MDTSPRSVRVNAGGATLSGGLTVPRGAQSLVVLVTGLDGRTGRENDIVDFLQCRGVGTFVVDLVAADEAPSRETRLDVDWLADRLREVLSWVHSRDAASSLDLGFFGADTGAAAVLRVLPALEADVAAAALLDGRVDLGGDPGDVCVPLLFVVDRDHDHMRRRTRRVYTDLGTDPQEKNVLWADADGDVVHVTTGWFESHLPTPRNGTAGHDGQRETHRSSRHTRWVPGPGE